MTKAIEDAANALAIRTALGVPMNADLAAVSDVADAAYVKPIDGIPHNDLHTGIRDQLDLADTALQPGVLPVGTTLPAAQISDATTTGRALLTAADAAAQRTALALGNVSNTADADKPVSTAQALAIAAKTTADAIADTFETAPAADLARIQAAVSGDPVARLRAAMTAAAVLQQLPAWLATPAWTTGEAIKKGAVRANAGNLYQAYSNGTCGATAPTHTSGAPTTDGGVSWVYYSRVLTTAHDPAAPTISWAASTGKTHWHPVANASAFYYSGGMPVALTALSGGAVQMGSALMKPGTGSAANNNYNQQGAYIQFWTDCPAPQILGGYTAYPDIFIAVEVGETDGSMRRLYDGPQAPAVNVGSGGMVIDWTAVGGRRPRKYRVWLQQTAYFSGVYTDARSRVWPAYPANGLGVSFEGDSLTAGANSFPIFGWDQQPTLLSRKLGIEDVVNNAVGGTGVIATNGGAQYTYLERMSNIVAVNKPIHIVRGLQNDVAQPAASVTAALVSYLNALRAALPNQLVIVMGNNGVNSGPSAGHIASDAAMAAAVAQVAHPLTKFVPVCSSPNPPFTGTGNISNQQPTGNASLYTSGPAAAELHPNQLGINHAAQWEAQAIAAAAAAW
ncbi:MAG: hypothetical protein RJA63_2 [Pseudomonadota bacterium]|jgi:hypothetical protein